VQADIAGGFPEAVHDSAQGRLVNAQHFRQAVLSDARGVHPELQIRVDISIQGHGFALFSIEWQRSEGTEELVLVRNNAIRLPKRETPICQHIVALRQLEIPKKSPNFLNY
jgi:hypothetical protein